MHAPSGTVYGLGSSRDLSVRLSYRTYALAEPPTSPHSHLHPLTRGGGPLRVARYFAGRSSSVAPRSSQDATRAPKSDMFPAWGSCFPVPGSSPTSEAGGSEWGTSRWRRSWTFRWRGTWTSGHLTLLASCAMGMLSEVCTWDMGRYGMRRSMPIRQGWWVGKCSRMFVALLLCIQYLAVGCAMRMLVGVCRRRYGLRRSLTVRSMMVRHMHIRRGWSW